MGVILGLGIFWTIYGVAGIFGFQVIDEKYRNHDWTAGYIRYRGRSWLMLGIPMLILCLLARSREINPLAMCLLILLCGIPAVVYTIINDRKYDRMRREE